MTTTKNTFNLQANGGVRLCVCEPCARHKLKTHLDEVSVGFRGPVLVVVREHVAQELDVDGDLLQGVYALADLLHSGIILEK